jgi:lysophospholipase L1-like esterase
MAALPLFAILAALAAPPTPPRPAARPAAKHVKAAPRAGAKARKKAKKTRPFVRVTPVSPDELPFLDLAANHIENPQALTPFFHAATEPAGARVHVFHVGDSHVANDVFPNQVRARLQGLFGNGGRGLVFPRRLLNLDEAGAGEDYPSAPALRASGGVEFNPGVAPGAPALRVRLSGRDGVDVRATSLGLFLHDRLGVPVIDRCGESDCVPAFHMAHAVTGPVLFSRETFADPTSDVTLRCTGESAEPHCPQVYALDFEAGPGGVVYHTIGTVGAQFKHYRANPYFLALVRELKPALVILSLGTNDAYGSGFSPPGLRAQLAAVVADLRGAGAATILLTTPPDTFVPAGRRRRQRVPNPRARPARDVIVTYAREAGLAYWDFYSVMGGAGAMKRWYAAGIAHPDLVHFTTQGYRLQGHLLAQALQAAYLAAGGAISQADAPRGRDPAPN